MFGRRNTYDDEYVIALGRACGLELKNIFVIRTFFALSQNNDVKFSQEWHDNMFSLEIKVCDLEGYKDISFFHHSIFGKRG